MPKPRIHRRAFLSSAAGATAGMSVLPDGGSAREVADATEPDDAPPAPLQELHQSVQAVIQGKRIGQPVFVRYTLQGHDKGKELLARLVQVAEIVRSWVGQDLGRVYAVGSPESGQLCLTLQFAGGATALVGFAAGKVRGDGADLMVIGNHGSLYHDSGLSDLWDAQPTLSAVVPDSKLLSAVKRSLHSGNPESVKSS